MGRDADIRGGVILLVAHLGGDLSMSFIEESEIAHRGHDPATRVGHQPAQQLLPEQAVAVVTERQIHLPAPRSSGCEHGRTAASVVLRHEHRHHVLAHVHLR